MRMLHGSISLLVLALGGCTQAPTETAPVETTAATDQHAHNHNGWWCTEHGVPEESCGLCDSTLAAQIKADGDWCQKHDRPDSQCFACHPEAEARFAALYEAKFGEKPPKPTE